MNLPPEQMQELIRRIQTDCEPLYRAMSYIYARAGASIIMIEGEPLDKMIPNLSSDQELVINQIKQQIDWVTKQNVNNYFGLPR